MFTIEQIAMMLTGWLTLFLVLKNRRRESNCEITNEVNLRKRYRRTWLQYFLQFFDDEFYGDTYLTR